jgi:hypothetical protein
MKKVFLSGPIRGLSRELSLGWRNKATELLKDFEVIHALRDREIKETLPDPRLAIIRDKRDIDASDILLVNDEFPEASMIGTSMEIIYAHERNKVVVIFGEGHEKDYWLNYHCHARVKTLEEACDLINNFFKK